jgi:hypothetical protein
MRYTIWFALLAIGCGESGELAALKASLRVSEEAVVKSTEAVAMKTDEAVTILKENTTALAAIKSQIDALQVVSKAQPLGGDPKSVIPPDSPAKANTQPTPVKVATPGSSSESLTELATRLYSQGVSVHMKTEDELKAIDAQLNGGQPVTGAIFQNNRTSAVTSQRTAVRLIPRGRGVVR